jgi:hypothetical protein
MKNVAPLPIRIIFLGIWRHPIVVAFFVLATVYFVILFLTWFAFESGLWLGNYTSLAALPWSKDVPRGFTLVVGPGVTIERILLPLFPLLLGFLGDRFHRMYGMDEWASTSARANARDVVAASVLANCVIIVATAFLVAAVWTWNGLLAEFALWWLLLKFLFLFVFGVFLARILKVSIVLFSIVGFVVTVGAGGLAAEYWSPAPFLRYGRWWALPFTASSIPDIRAFLLAGLALAGLRALLLFGLAALGMAVFLRDIRTIGRLTWGVAGVASIAATAWLPPSPLMNWTVVGTDWLRPQATADSERRMRVGLFSEPAARLVEEYHEGRSFPDPESYMQSLSEMRLTRWDTTVSLTPKKGVQVSFRASIRGGPDFLVFELPACTTSPLVRVVSGDTAKIVNSHLLLVSKRPEKELDFSCYLAETPIVPLSGFLWNLNPRYDILFVNRNLPNFFGSPFSPSVPKNQFLLHPILVPPFTFIRAEASNNAWQKAWSSRKDTLFTVSERAAFRWEIPADVWLVARTWSRASDRGSSPVFLRSDLVRLKPGQDYIPPPGQHISPFFSITDWGMLASQALIIEMGAGKIVSHPSWIPPGSESTVKRVFSELKSMLGERGITFTGTVYWGPEELLKERFRYPQFTVSPGHRWEEETLPGLCLRSLEARYLQPPLADPVRRYLCYSAIICSGALHPQSAENALTPDHTSPEERNKFLNIVKSEVPHCSALPEPPGGNKRNIGH